MICKHNRALDYFWLNIIPRPNEVLLSRESSIFGENDLDEERVYITDFFARFPVQKA